MMAGSGWRSPSRRRGVRPLAVQAIDVFEVTKARGRYEFKLNGRLVGTWTSSVPRQEWIRVWTGESNRAEFYDWVVEKQE
jgi:hypothetical protein